MKKLKTFENYNNNWKYTSEEPPKIKGIYFGTKGGYYDTEKYKGNGTAH